MGSFAMNDALTVEFLIDFKKTINFTTPDTQTGDSTVNGKRTKN